METTEKGCRKRCQFIELVENQGLPKSKACRIVGISRTYAYNILTRYYEEGIKGLETRTSVPHTFPTKISDQTKRKVIAIALKHPSRGAKWLGTELKKDGVLISEGKIFEILKSAGISKRDVRLDILLKRYQKGHYIDSETIDEMEKISPHFRIRSDISKKIGQTVYVWDIYGMVTNTKKRIPFIICLDSCGSVATITPKIDSLMSTRWHRRMGINGIDQAMQTHFFKKPLGWIITNFYQHFNCEPEKIILPSTVQGINILHDNLKTQFTSTVYSAKSYQFFSYPIIKDFTNYFKHEFLIKRLKQIRYLYNGIKAAQQISDCLSEFLNHYNKDVPINNWPNLGLSPYHYASRCSGKEIYLPPNFRTNEMLY